MALDNQGSRFGNRNDRRGGSRHGGPRTMYEATCDNCGNRCKVPFRPSNDKPVYCSNCFEQTEDRGGKSRRPDSGIRNYVKYGNDTKKSFPATCASCGKDCDVPFRPTPGKPIYCRDCFTKTNPSDSNRQSNTKSPVMNGVVKELQELNHKLDTIISLLTPVPAKTRAIDSQADLEDITASLLSLPVKKTKTKATTKKAAKSKAKPKPTKTK